MLYTNNETTYFGL